MPTNQGNLSDLLASKPFVEQAIWYRMLNKASISDKKIKNDFFENNKEAFQNYFLSVDENTKRYVQAWEGSYHAWKEELNKLKEQVINILYQEIKKMDYPSSADATLLVELAKAIGAILAVNLKTSQIRRFLGAVMESEVGVKKEGPGDFNKAHAEYLKVYLAYAAGRNESAMPLLRVLEPMISKIRNNGQQGWNDFNVFVRFVRSIVAYHKFYGGSE